MKKQRPEGMNDKMYRPEYDGPKVPPKPGRPNVAKPYPMPTVRPVKPGMRPPMLRPTDKKIDPNAMMNDDAKKAALEMMRKRSGK